MCASVSSEELGIRGKEVGDLHGRSVVHDYTKWNGWGGSDSCSHSLWQSWAERQRVVGDAINGLLQVFKSPGVVINGAFPIYILLLLLTVSENTGELSCVICCCVSYSN